MRSAPSDVIRLASRCRVGRSRGRLAGRSCLASTRSRTFLTCLFRTARIFGGPFVSPPLGGEAPPATRHYRRRRRDSAQGVLCNKIVTIRPQLAVPIVVGTARGDRAHEAVGPP